MPWDPKAFPNLKPGTFTITSPVTRRYNCIAWAAGDDRRWWWPGPIPFSYWPAGVPRQETAAAFIDAFASLGYVRCNHGLLEPGVDKIAIFANSAGTPTHAARQLASGSWTSKLGGLEDISHDLTGVDGPSYGAIAIFMSRPAPPLPPP